MIRIAIVEDNDREANLLKKAIEKFSQENNVAMQSSTFHDGLDFLANCRGNYDLVFMDIEMPLINGIDVARRLREVDPIIVIVFVTNMEQLAVKGYEVNALDFIVKPINYYRFSSSIKKAINTISKNNEKEIVLSFSSKMVRLKASQIQYVEIRDHLLIYHTDLGNYEIWGSLKDVEKELSQYNFTRSSNAYLVNLRHVVSLEGDMAVVACDRVPISQRRRKDFYMNVAKYLGGRN